MENRTRELIDLIVYHRKVSKTEISKELGYKSPTSFYTSIKNEALSQKQINKLLEIYEIEIKYKVK